jgi:uncharacterized protein (DUF2236 family)
MAWQINREAAVLLASGARSLLLQVAHPLVAAAVADHSRFRSDPLGRLRGTLDAIYDFAFADMQRVEHVVQGVTRLHSAVRGTTPDGEPYSALDPHLVLWVYATLIDTSILTYETFVQPLRDAEREACYAEFQRAAYVWGLQPEQFPPTLAAMRAWMATLIDSGEVHVTDQGRQLAQLVLRPRAWWWPVLIPFQPVTMWLLPPALREQFGYSWGPRREACMQRFAAMSRWLVPKLPRAVRDLPVARAAYKRIRARGARLELASRPERR